MNLAEMGRLFLQEHPDAQAEDLVENCGFKLSYAKVFIPAEKRRKEILERVARDKAAQAQHSSRNWEQEYNSAVSHINHLEKQIVGYKAVINYLEHQLSAMAEKHGSSV